MRQLTGDILSVGRELFIEKSSSNDRIELKEISSNRLDLKFHSVNENDSGIYTCMFNDEKLSAFLIQILSKSLLHFSTMTFFFDYIVLIISVCVLTRIIDRISSSFSSTEICFVFSN